MLVEPVVVDPGTHPAGRYAVNGTANGAPTSKVPATPAGSVVTRGMTAGDDDAGTSAAGVLAAMVTASRRVLRSL